MEVDPATLKFIQEFGLILFIFSIGLQVGPSFFSSFKHEGIQLNGIAMLIVALNVVVALAIYFVAIEGQKEGVNVKPDPSIVFSILAKTKMAKADCLYVGDSGVDMETARRACIDSVGVTWGFRSKKELVEYHADVIVNNPVEILSIVEKGIQIS